ncbi:hypothetical protein [Streptomyces sp. NPDC004135]
MGWARQGLAHGGPDRLLLLVLDLDLNRIDGPGEGPRADTLAPVNPVVRTRSGPPPVR